jgi:hypothetical protein
MAWVLREDEEEKPQGQWVLRTEQPLSWSDLLPSQETATGLTKAALSAVPKGIFNAIGAPADFLNLGKLGGDWLAGKMGASPEQIAQLQQVRDWMLPLGPLGSALPTSAQVQQGVEQFTGKLPLYEPQTRPEKAVDTAIQMAIGLGKPTASSLLKVVAPATAGTEVAGALSNDNPLWRAAGGLLGGGAAAATNAYLGIPRNAVREALGTLSPAEIAAAEARAAGGQRVGVPLTGGEAFDSRGLLGLTSDVMASRTGAPIMQNFLEKRPGQVRNAVERFKDAIAGYRSPGETAQLAEKTASDVLQGTGGNYLALGSNTARTARTSPFWEAQKRIDVGNPPNPDLQFGLQSIIGNIDSEIALAGKASDKGKILTGLKAQLDSATTPTQVDNVYQAFRKRLNPGPTASVDEQIAAGVLGEHVASLKALTDLPSVSPHLAAGRAQYERITQRETNPLQSSLVGEMAPGKKGLYDPSQPPDVKRVIGTVTEGADVNEIRQLHTHLNAQNPQTFPAIARSHLESTFDAATQRGQAGENVKLGANWVKDIRGTDQQRKNLTEILNGVADAHGVDGNLLNKGANVLFDTLESTGKIPGIGSQTAQRLATQAELGRNPITMATDALSLKPASAVGRWAEGLFQGRRNAQLAQWFTDPNSVDILVKMAKLKPDGITARYYLGQLLNLNKEASGETRQ